MSKNSGLSAAAAATVIGLASGAAHAQDAVMSTQAAPPEAERVDYFSQRVSAPRNAFELTVGTGYTQGFGMLQSGVGLPDVAQPGLAVDVGAGLRLDPHWAISALGEYQELTAERADSARGLTAGLGASYHFVPYSRTDPWLQLAAGYRMLWEPTANQPTVLTHGFQLARLTGGIDIRASRDVAIAPMIGADMNMFFWQNAGNGSVAIADPRLNTFVFAGLQGRFDFAGTREGGPMSEVAKR